MKQWIIKRLLAFMGNTYVWLDTMLVHETGPVLGLDIDEDFEGMTRKKLCEYIEEKIQSGRKPFLEITFYTENKILLSDNKKQ